MTDQTALVTFLLDKSGSMSQIRDDTIGAFNTYIDTLREDGGDGIDFTFLQFDSTSIDKVCVVTPIAKVGHLTRDTFVPRDSTPLIDAAVKTIRAVDGSLAKRSDKPKVIVCIQTDGQENASTEHTWDELNALIKEKTAAGWQFNFMGASIDAYAQAAKMGISTAATMSYDSRDTVKSMAAFADSASNTRMFARGARADTTYEVHQKQAAGDAFDPAARAGTTAAKPTPGPAKTKPRAIVDNFTL